MKTNFIRSATREFIGAFGDIGTLLPLLVALVVINGINPFTAVLGVGMLYIFTGLYYKIPLPVQPLKAMAAIAIISHASAGIIAAAALCMSLILILVAFFNLGSFLNRIFTKPIIRGIQLGVGLILIKEGIIFLFFSSSLIGFNSRLPTSDFLLALPSWENLAAAFFLLVIPQIPLTFGNALVATEDAARYYYGEKARRVKIRSLSISLALGNLWAGLTGGLPVCHGSGGLTAHYKFGARTGLATVIFGVILIALALVLGTKVIAVFSFIPLPILGLTLCFVGIHHCLLIKSLRSRTEFSLAFAIGLLGALTGNLSVAFIIGICLRYILMGVHFGLSNYQKITVIKKI